MNDKEHSNITFNIYGGSNQVLPNATTATQNFYGSRAVQDGPDEEKGKDSLLTPEAGRLSVYINKVEDLDMYLAQIVECTSAAELAKVIVNMAEREPNITQEVIVKEKFISLFLPITPKFTSGKSIDNIRARINDAWAKRPKRRI
ncbi:MAG: hypothetical protein LUI85_10845 [Bacteroides sp.]|nr:hypothetical protein [Bacteroides sp.]